MAKKKTLVYGSDGEIEQLQAGDYVQDENYLSQTNGESGSIVCGTPVYQSAADTVKKGNNAALATAKIIGLVVDTTIAASAAGNIQEEGVLVLTTAQWDAVAGTTGGLAAGVTYYLGGSGLMMTPALAPTASGISAPLGIALSTTEFKINIQRIVRL